ncbi:hypothetical protein MTO96_045045 [Rhipicephalus appendiculatus]
MMAQEPLNDVVNVDGLEVSLPTESPATMGTEEGSTSEWSGSGPDVGSESRHDSFSPSDDTDVERGGGPPYEEEWQRAYARRRVASAGIWCLVSLSAAAVLCLLLLQLRNDKGLSAILSRFVEAALALRLGGYS